MIKRHLLEFAESLRSRLLNDCPRTYLREAEEKKTFPYIVFDVRILNDIKLTIELDIWGCRGQEIQLSELADRIDDHLDGTVLSDPYFCAALYSNNDLRWTPDENKDIKHINLSFTATYQG